MKVSVISIIENMPKSLTNIEKVRYIYLEIGKIFSYNIEYIHCVDNRFAKDIYDEKITIGSIERKNYQNKILLVCKQASEILNEALNQIDIRSKCIGFEEENQYHVDVLVNLNNKKYLLNIISDVSNIQKGLKTKGFATAKKTYDGINCDAIAQENLKIIDKKLGYCKNDMYADEAILLLKEEMKNSENIKRYIFENKFNLNNENISKDEIFRYKVDFIFRYIKNNFNESERMELLELKSFFTRIFKEILLKNEFKNIKTFDFYHRKNATINYSTIYQIRLENENVYYIYDDGQRKFLKVSNEKLKEIVKNICFFNKQPECEK